MAGAGDGTHNCGQNTQSTIRANDRCPLLGFISSFGSEAPVKVTGTHFPNGCEDKDPRLSAPGLPRVAAIIGGLSSSLHFTWETVLLLLASGSQSVVPGPVASAAPENLLEMQPHGPRPRPAEAETLGVRPSELHWCQPPPHIILCTGKSESSCFSLKKWVLTTDIESDLLGPWHLEMLLQQL